VGKAAVDHALGGQPERLGSFNARFSGVVFPGETVVTRIWDEGDHLVVEADSKDRAKPVLTNGVIVKR
jgi:acyl dehydratase